MSVLHCFYATSSYDGADGVLINSRTPVAENSARDCGAVRWYGDGRTPEAMSQVKFRESLHKYSITCRRVLIYSPVYYRKSQHPQGKSADRAESATVRKARGCPQLFSVLRMWRPQNCEPSPDSPAVA